MQFKVSSGMTVIDESGCSSAFGFESVDGKQRGVESAGMIDVEATASDRSRLFQVNQVDREWRVDPQSRMETGGRLPGAIANATDKLPCPSGRL